MAELAVQAELAAIDQELCAAKKTVTFRIHYRCCFGQSVAVVGDCDVLGSWQVSNRLQWTENDFWQGTVKFPRSILKIQYKYVVVTDQEISDHIALWEPGENHTLKLSGEQTTIIDFWNYL